MLSYTNISQYPSVDIALYEPEKPANTGNIGRLCVGANVSLHIVGRPSFLLRDKEIKRAGLDYWEKLNLIEHKNLESFIEYSQSNDRRIVPVSKFAQSVYFEFEYQAGDILLLGKESTGLPEYILERFAKTSVYIQMNEDIRSLNVSNSAAIVLYEAWRQVTICR